jgi:hypothetical protein
MNGRGGGDEGNAGWRRAWQAVCTRRRQLARVYGGRPKRSGGGACAHCMRGACRRGLLRAPSARGRAPADHTDARSRMPCAGGTRKGP